MAGDEDAYDFPSADDLWTIKLMAAALRPYFNATMALEGDRDSSISVVYPEILQLLRLTDPTEPLELAPPEFEWSEQHGEWVVKVCVCLGLGVVLWLRV